jgi:Bacterial TniB protein
MKLQWKSEIRTRVAGLHLAPTREAAIVEELAQYLEDCYAELLAGGASEADAYEQALAELSGSEFLTRELRRMERQVPQEPIVLGTNRRSNTIKYLGNELQIPIVGVETYEAFNALQTDPQLANRFEPTVLPRWEQGQEYLRLLSSFERMLPLKQPTRLTGEDLAFKLA